VAAGSINPAVERGKLRSAEDSIRNFVLAADAKAANIVPLKTGNLALSNPEVEAFRADYGSEKSFRADFAAALRSIAAMQTRFMEEMRDYQSKQGSAYLWKPHADALTWLLTTAQTIVHQAADVLKVAEQRGLQDKVSTLKSSMQKLQSYVQQAAVLLQSSGS
jgi:hypothetical protein